MGSEMCIRDSCDHLVATSPASFGGAFYAKLKNMTFEEIKRPREFEQEIPLGSSLPQLFGTETWDDMVDADNATLENLRRLLGAAAKDRIHYFPTSPDVLFVAMPYNTLTEAEEKFAAAGLALASNHIGYGTGAGNVGFTLKENVETKIESLTIKNSDNLTFYFPVQA